MRPRFPDVLEPDERGQVASGGDLTPEVLIDAYQRGIFPWSGTPPIPWCAPNPRMILRPGDFRRSRSLAKLERSGRYRVRFDRDFAAVIRACATIPRAHEEGTWITPNMIAAYEELARRGIAHSVEVYEERELVGGLYGLTFGRAFFGESMFSRASNASKLALGTLCRDLGARSFHFVDCQAVTRHLLSLGAMAIPLEDYLGLLREALRFPSHHGSWGEWGGQGAGPAP